MICANQYEDSIRKRQPPYRELFSAFGLVPQYLRRRASARSVRRPNFLNNRPRVSLTSADQLRTRSHGAPTHISSVSALTSTTLARTYLNLLFEHVRVAYSYSSLVDYNQRFVQQSTREPPPVLSRRHGANHPHSLLAFRSGFGTPVFSRNELPLCLSQDDWRIRPRYAESSACAGFPSSPAIHADSPIPVCPAPTPFLGPLDFGPPHRSRL